MEQIESLCDYCLTQPHLQWPYISRVVMRRTLLIDRAGDFGFFRRLRAFVIPIDSVVL